VTSEVDVLGEPVILKNRHLKFWARQGGRVFEILAWDRAEHRTELKRGENWTWPIHFRSQTTGGKGKFILTWRMPGLTRCDAK